MRIKNDIAISDTGFVFNPSTGDSFTLNQIGKEIILAMKKNQSEPEILQFLQTRYDVDATTLEKNYYDFIQMLDQYNLVIQ